MCARTYGGLTLRGIVDVASRKEAALFVRGRTGETTHHV